LTNAFAVAKPIPLLPPVTTAIFPSSLFIEHLLVSAGDCIGFPLVDMATLA
jgi:hypothetical protein